MGTRSYIFIYDYDKKKPDSVLYHHYDSQPEDLVPFIREYLSLIENLKYEWSADKISKNIRYLSSTKIAEEMRHIHCYNSKTRLRCVKVEEKIESPLKIISKPDFYLCNKDEINVSNFLYCIYNLKLGKKIGSYRLTAYQPGYPRRRIFRTEHKFRRHLK